MNKIVLAQIFGLLGAISMLLSSWQKTRNKVLTFLILDSIFYLIEYIILGALSGAFINVVSIIRTIIFKYKDKNKIFQSNIILLLILLLYILVGVFTYNGLISIFPVVASILYAIVLWQDNVKKIRLGSAIMILSFLIYNIAVGAYLSILVELVLLISSITAIIKLDILNAKEKNLVQTNWQNVKTVI